MSLVGPRPPLCRRSRTADRVILAFYTTPHETRRTADLLAIDASPRIFGNANLGSSATRQARPSQGLHLNRASRNWSQAPSAQWQSWRSKALKKYYDGVST